jgi:hypothetical protein
MPSVSLHLALADRILDRWRRGPDPAPFDPSDPAAVRAFHHGAIGPDLGYFPGGERLLSDLAHRVRSVDLTRALIDAARSSTERAFSWGWVTHVLADRAIHPLVGRGVGEVVYGDPDQFVEGYQEPAIHVRVETGLDMVYGRRPGARPVGSMSPVFDGRSIRFLSDAYRAIYGIELGAQAFLESHRATARLSRSAILLTNLLSRLHPRDGALPRALASVRWTLARLNEEIAVRRGRATLTLAYLNPIPPSAWLREAVDAEVRAFPEHFLREFETGLASLENFDLDTGRTDVPGSPTPIAREILRSVRCTPGERPRPISARGAVLTALAET